MKNPTNIKKYLGPWIIPLGLSLISAVVLFLHTDQALMFLPPPVEDGSIELTSVGVEERIPVRAEIVEDGRRDAEMVIYSTSSPPTEEEASQEVTVELPDGNTVKMRRSDLTLGKQFRISREAADRIRHVDGQNPTDRSATDPRVFTMATDMARDVDSEVLQHRIVLEDMQEMASTTPPPEPGPPLPEAEDSLVLTLTTGPFRFAENGGWEIPIYVLARRKIEGSDALAATQVPTTMEVLVEATGTEPRTVYIEANRTRSTEAVYMPLRRATSLQITASDLEANADPAYLELSWQKHGPSLTLNVFPSKGEAYATRLSPIRLQAHVELDERRLRPGRTLPLHLISTKDVTIEPNEVVLGAKGEPVALALFGQKDAAEILTFQMPDLDLEAEVSVRFRRPYFFLALATLFGILGVIVARRSQLFAQRKRALVLEMLAAGTGGVLLYAAFLMEWLPAPGFLIGALPASAIGVLGGYAGEAVFQLLLKIVGLRPKQRNEPTSE